MEVFECIKTRRSVRRFEDRPVDHGVIREGGRCCSMGSVMEEYADAAIYGNGQQRDH